MAELVWTHTRPDNAGWYWHREMPSCEIEVVEVRVWDSVPYQRSAFSYGFLPLKYERGEWAGPIEMPREG
jgi:hypothetical protein